MEGWALAEVEHLKVLQIMDFRVKVIQHYYQTIKLITTDELGSWCLKDWWSRSQAKL